MTTTTAPKETLAPTGDPHPHRTWQSLAKQHLPWPAKIAAKILLSRLPVPGHLWKRLHLFEHGTMEDPSYALNVFNTHFSRYRAQHPAGAFTALELGPGDSLLSCVIARASGARATYLVDVGAFAATDPAVYQNAVRRMHLLGLDVPDGQFSSVQDLLYACGGHYLTAGLASLRSMPTESADFVWSQAVLEHVRQSEFREIIAELYRVMRAGGIASHRVDLQDHLNSALNNLRFSDRVWESRIMSESGFYTNRIRYSEMLAILADVGFDVEVVSVSRWTSHPTPRARLHPRYRHLTDEELLISGFDVVLRKPRDV